MERPQFMNREESMLATLEEGKEEAYSGSYPAAHGPLLI